MRKKACSCHKSVLDFLAFFIYSTSETICGIFFSTVLIIFKVSVLDAHKGGACKDD